MAISNNNDDFLRAFEESCPGFDLQNKNINYYYYEKMGRFESKDFKLPANFYRILHNLHLKKINITTLKLQNCGIRSDGVQQLSKLLSDIKCITDLSLDMNPNARKNHYLLCKRDCHLRRISLRLCNLEDVGVQKISEELKYKDSNKPLTLISLNLSNNKISDVGAGFLSNMLHTNRSIQSLDLTGNWITDVGTSLILDQLYIYALVHEEIVQLRKRKFVRLLVQQRLEKLATTTCVSDENESVAEAKQDYSKRQKYLGEVFNLDDSDFHAMTNETDANSMEFKGSSHPFDSEAYPMKGDIVAAGNLSLQHLNLSYNKLTEKILEKFIKIIYYHNYMTFNDLNRGLLFVNLEGNEIPENELFKQVNELLENRFNQKDIDFEDYESLVPVESKILKSQLSVCRK